MGGSPPPIRPGVEGPQQFLIPGPLSPVSALAALAADPNVEAATHAIVYSLVTTIHNCKQAWAQEKNNMEQEINKMGHKIRILEDQEEEEAPDGYIANKGYVDLSIPVNNNFLIPAKWIQQLSNRRVALLTGQEKNKTPYITDLYTIPNHDSDIPIPSLPTWFLGYLIGDSHQFHVLCSAVTKFNNWTYLAEVECYQQLDEQHTELCNQIWRLRAKQDLLEAGLNSCRFQMEAARLPSKVGHLEQWDPKQLR
jgi:hypothetical protein